MGINIANPPAHQLMSFNKTQHFLISRYRDQGERSYVGQNFGPVTQVTASQLSNNKRMDENLIIQ